MSGRTARRAQTGLTLAMVAAVAVSFFVVDPARALSVAAALGLVASLVGDRTARQLLFVEALVIRMAARDDGTAERIAAATVAAEESL